jgi:hypothetical protein
MVMLAHASEWKVAVEAIRADRLARVNESLMLSNARGQDVAKDQI